MRDTLKKGKTPRLEMLCFEAFVSKKVLRAVRGSPSPSLISTNDKARMGRGGEVFRANNVLTELIIDKKLVEEGSEDKSKSIRCVERHGR